MTSNNEGEFQGKPDKEYYYEEFEEEFEEEPEEEVEPVEVSGKYRLLSFLAESLPSRLCGTRAQKTPDGQKGALILAYFLPYLCC